LNSFERRIHMKTARELLEEMEKEEPRERIPVLKLRLQPGWEVVIRFLPLLDADYFGKHEALHNIGMSYDRGSMDIVYCGRPYGHNCAICQMYVECLKYVDRNKDKDGDKEYAWRKEYTRIYKSWTRDQFTCRVVPVRESTFMPHRFYLHQKSLLAPIAKLADDFNTRFWDLKAGMNIQITSDGTRYSLMAIPQPTPFPFNVSRSEMEKYMISKEPYFTPLEETRTAMQKWVKIAKEQAEDVVEREPVFDDSIL